MSDRNPINEGRIAWTGENHCLYLEAGPDGPWTAAFSVFRIKWSPFGAGVGIMALSNPDAKRKHQGNFCLNDNPPLFRWLADDFAVQYAAFRDRCAFKAMSFDALESEHGGHTQDGTYVERFVGAGRTLALEWIDLHDPVHLELPPGKTSTGRHEVFGTYITAGNASARLNDQRLGGAIHTKPFLAGQTTSAYLIFSETWIVPHCIDNSEKRE